MSLSPTITKTWTATSVLTPTYTVTPTFTVSSTYTYTFTPSFTPTPTTTPSQTITNTPVPAIPTATYSFTITLTPTITLTFTNTFTPIPTGTPITTYTPCPSTCNCSTLKANGQDTTNVYGPNYCISNAVSLLLDTNVFGMPLEQVQSISDSVGNNSGSLLQVLPPSTTNQPGLYYFSGNLTYDPNAAPPYNQLYGTGLLIVDGELNITSGVNSATSQPVTNIFQGVIYCTGNIVINAVGSPVIIEGAVILGRSANSGNGQGTLHVNGTTDYMVQIGANPAMVQNVVNSVCTYRLNSSAKKSFLNVPNW